MDLLPEQQRALAYMRRRGTEAPLAQICSRLARTYRDIEALTATVDAARARQRPAPSAWSVQEIVDHLVETEHRAARQLAGLLAGSAVDDPIPAGLQSPRPFEIGWQALRDRFRSTHARILELLDSASDDMPLAATAPVELVVKCAAPDGTLKPVHWVEKLDWKAYSIVIHMHNREHIAQVLRALDSIGQTSVQ